MCAFLYHSFPTLRSPGVFGGRGLDALPPDDKVITGKSDTRALTMMCVGVATQLAKGIVPQDPCGQQHNPSGLDHDRPVVRRGPTSSIRPAARQCRVHHSVVIGLVFWLVLGSSLGAESDEGSQKCPAHAGFGHTVRLG